MAARKLQVIAAVAALALAANCAGVNHSNVDCTLHGDTSAECGIARALEAEEKAKAPPVTTLDHLFVLLVNVGLSFAGAYGGAALAGR